MSVERQAHSPCLWASASPSLGDWTRGSGVFISVEGVNYRAKFDLPFPQSRRQEIRHRQPVKLIIVVQSDCIIIAPNFRGSTFHEKANFVVIMP